VDFSLRELARQAGVTAAASYHHFENKSAVLDEVATAGFEGLEKALLVATHSAQNPADKLTQMVLAYLQFSSEHASHYQVMFPRGLGSSGERPLRTVAEAAFARLLDAVRQVRPDAGEEDLLLWAFSIWALCHGVLTLRQNGLISDELPFARTLPRIAALCANLATQAKTTAAR
jgi:AcrR family transcriptional regulator